MLKLLQKSGNKSSSNNNNASAVGDGSAMLVILLDGLRLGNGHRTGNVGGSVGDVDRNLGKLGGGSSNGSGLDGDSESVGAVGVDGQDPGAVASGGGAGNDLRGLALVNEVQRAGNPLQLSLGGVLGEHDAKVGGGGQELAVSGHKVAVLGVKGRGGIVGSEGGHGNQGVVLDGHEGLGPGGDGVLALGVKVDVRGGLVDLGGGQGGEKESDKEHCGGVKSVCA